MAAIDKLYVRTYEEYDEVRRWALAYYPKLLLYFYNISVSYKEFNALRKKWFTNTKIEDINIDDYTFPVTNTPFKVDRKLKWICPVPCVREYLHKQCGVNPKWEWLYKIFWRGKEHF